MLQTPDLNATPPPPKKKNKKKNKTKQTKTKTKRWVHDSFISGMVLFKINMSRNITTNEKVLNMLSPRTYNPFIWKITWLAVLYNYWLVMRATYDMLDLKTKCCPRPKAEGNILSEGPTYHMLPESPVNQSFHGKLNFPKIACRRHHSPILWKTWY